ncbi:MAG: hypothetical protein LLF81_02170 [Porphyromonadaceae bacterium]|nr:hypothetical protein [Porphyromonadaceae bacterium]
MYPGSKRSSLEESRRYLEQPGSDLHEIYRALSALSRESDFIQSQVYKNSKKTITRKTGVIYYDCTNYYFESEQESGLRQYGLSKEHRPNPLVQMGLFMDMDGMPLAYENGLEQKLIVTYCPKYRDYLRYIRDRQLERARTAIGKGAAKLGVKRSTDYRRFISQTNYTPDGEVAPMTSYTLDMEMIGQEERFDGYYGVCTDHLHGPAGFRTDTQIITRQTMRRIISSTRKKDEK